MIFNIVSLCIAGGSLLLLHWGFENNSLGTKEPLGIVELVIVPKVGSMPLFLDSAYSSPASEKFKLKTLKFFLSEIALSRSMGEECQAMCEESKHGIFLVNFSEPNFDAGFGKQSVKLRFNVKEGEYSDIRLNIGVPRKLNHQDPTSAPPPLDIGKGDMFWSWNSGYIFFLAEGQLLGADNRQLHLAIGGDSNIMPCAFGNLFNVNPQLKVRKGKVTQVWLAFDFLKLLSNGDGSSYTFETDEKAIVHGGYEAVSLRNNAVRALLFTDVLLPDSK